MNDAVRRYFWIKGNSGGDKEFHLYPTPDGVFTVAHEYEHKFAVEDSGGTLKEEFTADTDTFIIDEDLLLTSLKWRFYHSKGLPYAEHKDDFFRDLQIAKGNDGGAQTLEFGADKPPQWPLAVNVPESGYGS